MNLKYRITKGIFFLYGSICVLGLWSTGDALGQSLEPFSLNGFYLNFGLGYNFSHISEGSLAHSGGGSGSGLDFSGSLAYETLLTKSLFAQIRIAGERFEVAHRGYFYETSGTHYNMLKANVMTFDVLVGLNPVWARKFSPYIGYGLGRANIDYSYNDTNAVKNNGHFVQQWILGVSSPVYSMNSTGDLDWYHRSLEKMSWKIRFFMEYKYVMMDNLYVGTHGLQPPSNLGANTLTFGISGFF